MLRNKWKFPKEETVVITNRHRAQLGPHATCDLSWAPCWPWASDIFGSPVCRLRDPSYDKCSRQHRHPQAGRIRGSLARDLQGRMRIWITGATQALGPKPGLHQGSLWGSGSSVGVLYTGMCRRSSRERCLLEVQHHPEGLTVEWPYTTGTSCCCSLQKARLFFFLPSLS